MFQCFSISIIRYHFPLNPVKISKISIFFLGKKNIKKNCSDLGVGQNLSELAKIFMPDSLKKNYLFFFKKNK
jgi:hypothetical protein